MKYLIISISLVLFITGCSEKKLKKSEAEKLITEWIEKAPYKTVSFYYGFMTDPGYVKTYKKIAADKKYLIFEPSVYNPAAKRKMPRISLTEKGEKALQCEKNRCTANVCSFKLKEIKKIASKAKNATVTYDYDVVCDTELYKSFNALADRQFVKSDTLTNTVYLNYKDGSWKIVR